jgi:hypothetical protein
LSLFLGWSWWSLGLSLFLELLLALAMLQGCYFLLFVHLSYTKYKLWELFYHITREVERSPEGESPKQNSKIKGQKSK